MEIAAVETSQVKWKLILFQAVYSPKFRKRLGIGSVKGKSKNSSATPTPPETR